MCQEKMKKRFIRLENVKIESQSILLHHSNLSILHRLYEKIPDKFRRNLGVLSQSISIDPKDQFFLDKSMETIHMRNSGYFQDIPRSSLFPNSNARINQYIQRNEPFDRKKTLNVKKFLRKKLNSYQRKIDQKIIKR